MAEFHEKKMVVETVEFDNDEGEIVNRRGEVMEFTGKKRKTRRKEEEMMETGELGFEKRDPLVALGSDVIMMILSRLDARTVALSLLVSRGWYGVASTDRLWTTKCEELWLQKAHIPRISQGCDLSKLAAYSLSVIDGKRTRIMKEDLWDHAWEFHFNKVAPEYFRNRDPYWKGTGQLMRRYFHPDGSQTADADDIVWGGHEASYYTVTSFLDDDMIREHYVRINRWPRLSISRKQDWGWEMSNSFYTYSSIPDANKEGGTGPLFPYFRFTA